MPVGAATGQTHGLETSGTGAEVVDTPARDAAVRALLRTTSGAWNLRPSARHFPRPATLGRPPAPSSPPRPIGQPRCSVLAALAISVIAGSAAADAPQARGEQARAFAVAATGDTRRMQVGPPAVTTTSTAPFAAGDPAGGLYRLAAGDLVRVTVYQNPDLTLETRLPDSGRVSFPLLGPVELAGLTVAQAEERLARALRDGRYVRAPHVTLALLEATGRQASVLGQVNRPGRYPIALSGLRLTELLALAGGATAGGADRVVLSGRRDGQPWRTEIDLAALFANAGPHTDRVADPAIQPGDTVWVDRQPQVYVVGQVQRPGALRLERDMTLLQVLAAGGGLTPRGTERGIRVHRTLPDGRIQVLQPAMDALLRSGDVVQVAESLF